MGATVTRVRVTKQCDRHGHIVVTSRHLFKSARLNFRPAGDVRDYNSLQRPNRHYTFLALKIHIHAVILPRPSYLHGLNRAVASGRGTIVFRGGPCFWPRPQQSSQSQREGQRPASYSRTKIRYNERGLPRAVRCTFGIHMLRMLILGFPSSGRLMSLCC